MYRLILASRSPRRRDLLAEAGYDFDVRWPSSAEECGICSGESPPVYVARLAYDKARDVVAQLHAERAETSGAAAEGTTSERPRRLVLGCDTVVECQGQILGKPLDEEHAARMLRLLNGREHRVYSGLCLWPTDQGEPQIEVDQTLLRMDPLSREQMAAYLATGQWEGKAGAFGYQDGWDWLHVLSGSESNIVGLPLELLARMLANWQHTRDG